MHSHYYSRSPQTARRPGEAELVVGGRTYRLATDAGVFSKDHVDRGTRLLIEAMEKGRVRLPAEGRICDLGCGYGPLGIAAALMRPSAEVYMVDVNERAVELAQENVVRLGLDRRVTVRRGDGVGCFAPVRFHLVLTNPPLRTGKDQVHRLLAEAHDALEPGGTLALVARTQQGAKSLARFLEERFGEVREAHKGGGFRVYEAIRS